MEENRTESCSMLCWVKGISAAVAATKSELGYDLYQEKKVLNPNNSYPDATDCPVIVLGSRTKPRPQPDGPS